MEKMQILFPEQQLARLRRIAKSRDRAVSEIIRNAVDFWLSRYGGTGDDSAAESPPSYGCGRILVDSASMRTLANEDRDAP